MTEEIGEIHEYLKMNTLLNNQWVQEEIGKEITKYFEMNNNENTMCQNLGIQQKPCSERYT